MDTTWRWNLVVCLFSLTAGCSFDGLPGTGGAGSPADPGDPPPPAGPFQECAGTSDAGDQLDDDIACLAPQDDPTAAPLVVIESAFEDYDQVPAVHLRLTFNPTFVDNTYGASEVGWSGKGHSFKDLVGSDHAALVMRDGGGATVFDLQLDYISEDATAPCGYASLGPFGGDGKVNAGDESLILGWATSLEQNLNDRGYCFTDSSPVTTGLCEPPDDAPGWDFRVVYDLWVAKSAFDPAGYGGADMESVHASPSKSTDTIAVTPVDCPEDGTGGCLDPDGCGDADPGPVID